MKKLLAILFLLAVTGLAALLAWSREQAARAAAPAPLPESESPAAAQGLHEAMWYESLAGGLVHCQLCPNSCRIPDGQIGLCRVRQNIGGRLYSLSYGRIAAQHVDPVEKKPFFHVLPGSRAFSLATPGCNLRCLFCQNWEISQAFPWEVSTRSATPEEVVEAALASGCASIAFTYSEPTIFYEYMLDIARLAKARGLKTVVVSAGYIQPGPLKELLPFIDAYKIDFKAFDPEFYTRLTGGSRDPVLDAMKTIHASGVWLEIVNLLVTDQNDGEDQVRALARWVKDNLGPDVPLHFSRFFPQHRLQNLPPTPPDTLQRAKQIAEAEGIRYVYLGNVSEQETSNTYCPACRTLLIRRSGYAMLENNLRQGRCPKCNQEIYGIWN